MCSLDLEDVWRNYCTEKRSNKKRTSDQKIKSTLDYWLTSKQLQQPLSVRKCEINLRIRNVIIIQCTWKLRKKRDNQKD